MIDLSTSITHAAELYNKGVNTDDRDKGYHLIKEAAAVAITHAAELYNKGVNTDDRDKGYYLMKEAAAVAISALKLSQKMPDTTDKYSLIKSMVDKGFTADQIQDILVVGI